MKFLLYLLVTICLAGLSYADDSLSVPAEDWHFYKSLHNKKYQNESHEIERLRNFKKTKAAIDKCNSENLSYKCAVNQFSDLSPEQVITLHKGLKVPQHALEAAKTRSTNKLQASLQAPSVPASVDWRTVPGVVSAVKNQGQCGSCYTFSANGALEGQLAIKNKWTNQNLAEQQLVDCLPTGCNGGWMNDVFSYQAKNGVVQTANYPYVGYKKACSFLNSWKAFTKGFKQVPPNDAALMKAVAEVGPIAIAIDAGGNFQNYQRGVFYNPNCNAQRPTHAMLLVGYGVDSTTRDPFWLIKNSWGTTWGEQGYVRLSRRYENHCGISGFASYPDV